MPETLPELDPAVLETAVRTALARPEARVARWQVASLGFRIINQVTRGLYRVSGELDDGTPFGLVLKLITGTVREPDGDFPPAQGPSHWNYWRREACVYASEFARILPDGCALPRVYAIAPHGPDELGLYLEAIEGEPADVWPAARYGLAARQLGRLQGAFTTGAVRFTAPWTSRNWLLDWSPAPKPEDYALVADREAWRHPWLAALADAPPKLERLFASHGALLAASQAVPRTLCHLDCWAPNMIARERSQRESETVFLDWALLGEGGLGEDPSNMVYDSVWMLRHPPEQLEALASEVWDGYLAGLREGGWQGPAAVARLGYASASALRFGTFGLLLARAVRDPIRLAAASERLGRPAEAIVRARAAVAAHALELAQEAIALLG